MNPLPGDLFARNLRRERERLGLSQAEVARRSSEILGSNLDPTAVTRVEQGTRTVRLDEAVAIAQALDVPLPLLYSEAGALDTAALLARYRVELAQALSNWEKDRLEVQRIMLTIQTITAGDTQIMLEPRLRDAIDARVAEERNDDPADSGATDPGA
ncbi:helix-turn-helix domain-containing protein [Amycolatopsis sp. TNS106]|uniref:helix-turn-helix domain-containing protein n=1 Tax=Amycolatopsis sp. TNS106 TaxID=2861750 RepID=UPI001C599384|nr:helix-turn-helix transcriptional regulator [Amycolatopsis sp. TNS106]QXV62911.1 XRE family transcriptional regulator [Amycolatopsis sp. TNS106]